MKKMNKALRATVETVEVVILIVWAMATLVLMMGLDDSVSDWAIPAGCASFTCLYLVGSMWIREGEDRREEENNPYNN